MFGLGNEPVGFRSPPSFNNDVYNGDNSSSLSTVNTLLPLPNWQTSRLLWKSGWPIHIYGFSLLFLILSLFSMFVGIKFRQRICRLKAVLNITVLICVTGLLRVFYLCVDPYGYNRILSPVLVGVLSQLIYPLLCASYGLIQIMLLRITRLDVGRSKLRNSTPLLVATLIYLFGIVLIEVIVYYENKTKFLLILDNGFFIALALYLCISFICNGFRLSQYAAETKRVRKQLDQFNVDRKTKSTISVSRSSTSLRLARPQFTITNGEQMTITIASDAESTSSNNEIDNNHHVRFRKRRHNKSSVNRKMVRSQSGTRSEIFDSELIMSPESGLDGISDTSFAVDDYNLLSINKLHPTQIQKNDNVDSQDLIEQLEPPNYNLSETILQCSDWKDSQAAISEHCSVENGYLADTEMILNSPKLRNNTSTNDVESMEHSDLLLLTDNDLKSRTALISLFRIRQGIMLQRVIQVTYCTTFLFLFAILLQLYTVFGVYGVLNTNYQPEPWPWFTFQTLFRSTELCIGLLLMTILYNVLNHRNTRGRRKQQTSSNCVV